MLPSPDAMLHEGFIWSFVMFVYCTCCHHWLCSIVVGRSLLESTIVPHQSALYGYHATKTVVLEWCSGLMYSGSHFWLGGWVVCCHWGWQYHWCGQWGLWWKKCYVQTQRWDFLHMMISPGIPTCPMQFHMILYGILVSLFEPWTPHRIIRWNQKKYLSLVGNVVEGKYF